MTEMKSDCKIAAILLAAGNSERLGRPKQLLKFGDEYLINLIIKQIELSVTDVVVVVLGAYEPEIRKAIRCERSKTEFNSDWSKGIGTSIKYGLEIVMKKYPDLSGVLFAVVDQPALSKEHIDVLIMNHKSIPERIIASKYEDTIGIPALFGSRYYDEILKIGDNEGCKSLIKTHIENVIAVDFPEGAVDIDTEADLMNIKQSFNARGVS